MVDVLAVNTPVDLVCNGRPSDDVASVPLRGMLLSMPKIFVGT
jgi:hypothetical protein